MVTAGLYQHKKGNLYRVLFIAEWWGTPGELAADALVHVAPNEYGVGLIASQIRTSFMTALWNGNTGEVEYRTPIVIYVALYGDGRVAARRLDEFEQRTGGDIDVARFERIGE